MIIQFEQMTTIQKLFAGFYKTEHIEKDRTVIRLHSNPEQKEYYDNLPDKDKARIMELLDRQGEILPWNPTSTR